MELPYQKTMALQFASCARLVRVAHALSGSMKSSYWARIFLPLLRCENSHPARCSRAFQSWRETTAALSLNRLRCQSGWRNGSSPEKPNTALLALLGGGPFCEGPGDKLS